MTMPLRVYIGVDDRFEMAYRVAARSAEKFGCIVTPLRESVLRASGMLTRPVDTRGETFDLVSGAPQSTAFATARFWTPLLAHSGWALFIDSDVVFVRDPNELRNVFDDRYAVMCVQHSPMTLSGKKMNGATQTSYARKLWSSVCAYNCDHDANRRLNLQMLNSMPGRDLHKFFWLADSEIGALEPSWNWLVNLQPQPPNLGAAHFTNGTPNLVGYENCEGAELWHAIARELV